MAIVNARHATFLGWFCVAFALLAFGVTLTIVLTRGRPELIGAAIATLAPLIPGVMLLVRVKRLRG